MGAIFRQELRDTRGLFWMMMAAVVGVQCLPEQLCRTWSAFAMLLVLPMFCCYLGVRLLAFESDEQRLEHLLSLPVSRVQLWIARVGAGLALVCVTTAVSSPFFLMNLHASNQEWTVKIATWVTAMMATFGAGAFFSLVCRRATTACFVTYTACMLGATLLDFGYHRLPIQHHLSQISWGTSMYLLMWAGSLLTGSCWVFCRADLPDVADRRRALARAAVGVLVAMTFVGLGVLSL